jgi:hypothetical protein
VLSDEGHDFTITGVAPDPELGKHDRTVHGDLERAARRLDQSDVSLGEPLPELGRRPDGPRLVVSDDAVLDGESHAGNLIPRPRGPLRGLPCTISRPAPT